MLPVSFGAPVRPVWPLSIGLKDQLKAPSPGKELRQNLPATFTHNIRSTLRSKSPFLFVQVTRDQFFFFFIEIAGCLRQAHDCSVLK